MAVKEQVFVRSPGLADLSEGTWRTIAEQAHDYFKIIDLDYQLMHCSRVQKVEDWEHIQGRSVFDFVDEQFHDCMREAYDKVAQTRAFATYEVEMELGKHGRRRLFARVGPFDEGDGITGLVVYLHDHTPQFLAEQALKHSEDRYQDNLRQLSSELSSAQDRERRRIANLLHDDVGQVLALVRVRLDGIARKAEQVDDECYRETQEMDRMLRDTIRNVRSLTFELCSPVLYQVGFEAAVRDLCKDMECDYGLAVRLKLGDADAGLSDDLRGLLYRITRELVLNVIKHAQATTLTISSVGEMARYELEFVDDGIGFDFQSVNTTSGVAPGFGLFSIREQVGHIGGEVRVESQENKGTRVRVAVPI